MLIYITLVIKETVGHIEKPWPSVLLLRTVETLLLTGSSFLLVFNCCSSWAGERVQLVKYWPHDHET